MNKKKPTASIVITQKSTKRSFADGKAPDEERKTTIAIRECLEQALDAVGGRDFFIRLALGSSEDRRTFAQLCGRLIPAEISGKVEQKVTVTVVKQVLEDLDQIKTVYDVNDIGLTEDGLLQ